MEFSRQEYWSRLPLVTPGDLPDPEIEPMSPASPTLAGRFFTTKPPGKPARNSTLTQNKTQAFKERQQSINIKNPVGNKKLKIYQEAGKC